MEGCSHSQGPHRCGNRQSTGSVEEELLHCFPWNRGLRADIETRQEAVGTRPAAAYQNHLSPREVLSGGCWSGKLWDSDLICCPVVPMLAWAFWNWLEMVCFQEGKQWSPKLSWKHIRGMEGSQQEGQTDISRGQGDDVFPQSEERILPEVGKQCPSNQGKAFGPWKM